MTEELNAPGDFVRDIVTNDIKNGKNKGAVVTRFPPEPNGYLHIGHAKAICIDFGIAREFGGHCHLRMDDTNPEKEDVEYVDSIMEDVHWLGFDWGKHMYYASDYFPKCYEYAIELIKLGKAYACGLTQEEFKDYRGVPTKPGKESPYRNRPVEESLQMFERMKNGEIDEGACCIRAKIDMTSPNIHMRDPVIYRIKKDDHHRTGSKWCIYPTYDYAHCLSDSIEGITHSICTLEFEVHRPLYDWILDQLKVHHPQQIEFARLNLSYTIMSKRKFLELVQLGHVKGWDDPRMPTVSGLRRRGYTPSSIRNFCTRIGVTKVESVTDIALLEYCIRDELNKSAPRAMAVLKPVKVILENYPEDKTEMMDCINNPEDPSAGTRKVPFCRELYIEEEDFMENAPKKYFRMTPGQEVRLRYAYIVRCTGVIKEADGRISEIRCTYDPATKGGDTPDGRKIKGTIHWVSARHCEDAEVRLYDRLFKVEQPDADETRDFKEHLNPHSLEVVTAKIEPSLKETAGGSRCQFERKGYFYADHIDSKPGKPVFNQIVNLKDTWAKLQKADA